MILRTIVRLLIALIACSCMQQPSENRLQHEKDSNQHFSSQSGLRIDNRVNRGTGYTDSQGTDYSLRYIPITITNEDSIPIRLQIDFSKEYDYPIENSDEKFKVLLLPKVYSLDGVKLTTDNELLKDSLQIEFRNYLENGFDTAYQLNEILDPNDKFILTIGTQYPRPAKISGVLPRTLFVLSDTTTFPMCEWLMEKNRSSNQQIPLGLQIIIGDSCMIIPCGSISYLKN